MKNTYYIRGLTLLVFAFVLLNFSSNRMSAETPWIKNPQAVIQWKPYTGIPASTNIYMYGRYYNIKERKSDGKVFAQLISWRSPQRLLVANSSTNLVFTEVPVVWDSIVDVCSSAMVKWAKPYDEYFVSSYTGVWRFDEESGQFVPIWNQSFCAYNNCDNFYIRSLGDRIYISIANWGGGSGDWIQTQSGHVRVSLAPGSSQIWTDEISGNYGQGIGISRVISTNLSILIRNGSWYSFDGGMSYYGRAGTLENGSPLYVSDFYEYSGTNIVVADQQSNNDLYIGSLGGTMYPLNCPSSYVTTFFYSPRTRLLIAGDSVETGLYYTILPSPDQMLPELSIEKAVIISWHISNAGSMLQSSTNILGPWVPVVATLITNGNRIEASVRISKNTEFFRLSN